MHNYYLKCTWILIVISLLACDSDSANDCLQTAGRTVRETSSVPNFERILVNRDIELIVKQGENYEVTIETGNNLIADVTAEVIGNQLIITDNNTCNFVRDFGITKFFVTTPTLTEIRCSTQLDIRSDGVLAFDNLRLISENFNMPDTFPIGDFYLDLDVENLQVLSNNLSFFYLSGKAEQVSINFPAGNGRFEGGQLIGQHITVSHRGTNDMIVNPQQSLSGAIVSNGNVIALNQPPDVDVDELFNGRLIFSE